jgi:hypothetical protein
LHGYDLSGAGFSFNFQHYEALLVLAIVTAAQNTYAEDPAFQALVAAATRPCNAMWAGDGKGQQMIY